ncbi:hypothetical protein XHC_1393 [Xanthomonas hortorum pv. carotae str. M081]|nr:hypothetical protein XHC_1393 [Xanthomonas hortorum pv. carotae str. M081]
MRPHDLGSGVAVNALAGCIPATHVTARIERVDRAIAHALEQQLALPAVVRKRPDGVGGRFRIHHAMFPPAKRATIVTDT